jgi:hypothetical protein
MDLTRVTLPTFVLEPKSMLERITNFMSHPELLFRIPTVDDPEKRFIEVVRFYLSGFHILPPVLSHGSNNYLLVGCEETLEPDPWGAFYLQMEIRRWNGIFVYSRASQPSSANVCLFLHVSGASYTNRWSPQTEI